MYCCNPSRDGCDGTRGLYRLTSGNTKNPTLVVFSTRLFVGHPWDIGATRWHTGADGGSGMYARHSSILAVTIVYLFFVYLSRGSSFINNIHVGDLPPRMP